MGSDCCATRNQDHKILTTQNLNKADEANSSIEDDEDIRKQVLLDEDSILESNSVSYPTLKNMLE
jgi:hypothetical protein